MYGLQDNGRNQDIKDFVLKQPETWAFRADNRDYHPPGISGDKPSQIEKKKRTEAKKKKKKEEEEAAKKRKSKKKKRKRKKKKKKKKKTGNDEL